MTQTEFDFAVPSALVVRVVYDRQHEEFHVSISLLGAVGDETAAAHFQLDSEPVSGLWYELWANMGRACDIWTYDELRGAIRALPGVFQLPY